MDKAVPVGVGPLNGRPVPLLMVLLLWVLVWMLRTDDVDRVMWEHPVVMEPLQTDCGRAETTESAERADSAAVIRMAMIVICHKGREV
jgi:hypothetical protein